jgi:hypothetical protein
MTNHWPKQSECDSFYGNPRGNGAWSAKWYRDNVVQIQPPFKMWFGGKPVTRVSIHKKCAPSLARVLTDVWQEYNCHQEAADMAGVTTFSGTMAYRAMRGGVAMSMHAYGCAIDFDAVNNPMGKDGRFEPSSPLVQAFKREGWIWGGDWKGKSRDDMHFQAAIVG